AQNASEHNDYYSAASYCFSANINLKRQYYLESNISAYTLNNLFRTLEQKTNALDTTLAQRQIETIADLQTRMIVKERLNDVHDQIKLFRDEQHSAEESAGLLAYAEERFFSAVSWMDFFTLGGKKLIVNPELFQNSCRLKISEAEERQQYAELYVSPQYTNHIAEKVETARKALGRQEYELCLIMASQAKADANAILSTLGLDEENLPAYLQSKRKAVERIIAENSAEGVFPILGFSYYQYANSLQAQEPFTSLVYLEYALEMSDLSIYFPEQPGFMERTRLPQRIAVEWWYALGGLAVGLLIGALIFRRKKRKAEKKETKTKRKK
ncbi:LPXTG cell wall anchor domain-containing protein, partial [Candidatus Woesearchaeota archaeon]|nr:LPXTG cell wall anchor domain-containing protein [Candidatus Woesearchaeota archaeon]